MLHGSLWDPEDDVKENVGAYVGEVCTPRSDLSLLSELFLTGCTSFESWRNMALRVLPSTTFSQTTAVTTSYLEFGCGDFG